MTSLLFSLLMFVSPLASWASVSVEPPVNTPIELTPERLRQLREIAFQAARDGDAKTIQEYLKIGRPINEENARGDTLLIVAAYYGHLEIVESLLREKQVKVDGRNRMGLTALAAAAFKGYVPIAKRLLKAGADVNAASASGQTALMFAALSNRSEMVEYLLNAGANKDAKDRAGNTPLSLARTQGATEVIRLLEKPPVKKP